MNKLYNSHYENPLGLNTWTLSKICVSLNNVFIVRCNIIIKIIIQIRVLKSIHNQNRAFTEVVWINQMYYCTIWHSHVTCTLHHYFVKKNNNRHTLKGELYARKQPVFAIPLFSIRPILCMRNLEIDLSQILIYQHKYLKIEMFLNPA